MALLKNSALREASFTPLYKQIKSLILQSLNNGEWKPGESIPSEFELAKTFQVSQGTVRKAIDELAAENVLIRRQGKGTFVATHHEAKVRYRFLSLVSDHKVPKQRARSQVLKCERVVANLEQSKAFKIKVNSELVYIQRLLFLDECPTILDNIWLRADLFEGLDLNMLNKHKIPLYGLFETEFGVSMVRADDALKAVVADEEKANLLQVKVGTPLLQVYRTSYSYGDKPVELRQGFYLTDHYHYQNRLK
ncbi:GntR family transcriptional regulator [Basilea psittacipulmonis]|uniref:GntR family transcriptional regulator n=1 Tax=Basilea psittacipulmonis DSM 24701 TaxID=1072685 RepID=A0A077DBI6_9BURK|nr:GntR family transcriptional regulator [Basilea psittacipulmonis]AIL32205.1 GntR family transcriptional regulator [Basilea psittacipulmonis DSM 24701]